MGAKVGQLPAGGGVWGVALSAQFLYPKPLLMETAIRWKQRLSNFEKAFKQLERVGQVLYAAEFGVLDKPHAS